MIDGTLIPAIRELGDIFSSVSNGPIGQFYDWLGKTIDRVVQLSADLGAMTGLDEVGKKFGAKPYIGQGRIQDRINSAFEGTSYTTPKADKPGTELTVTKPNSVVKPITLADYPVTGGSGTKGGRGSHRATADDRFAETIQDVKDRTAALKEEQATLGASFEAQQKRSVALQLEQEALRQVREEARRKGDADWQNVQLSPEQVKQIDEVSAAYARQADALRQATEVQELQRDVLKGVFQDVRSALADGKITTEEWGNIFLNVLDKIIDKIEDQLIDAILSSGSAMGGAGAGGGGLGIIGALIGGVGKLLGFEKGGYTGEGGLDEPKGVVHGKEFVVNARATARNRPLLEALNRGVPGFRAGGFVGKNMGALMGSKLGFAFPTGGEAGMGVSGSLPV
jgi:lambda family phage tail tape measure protein